MRGNPMSDSFVSALYAAEHELIITTRLIGWPRHCCEPRGREG
jgi:hypothetical protein